MESVVVNSKRWLSLENLEGEEWHIIEEYPNYAVSNYGRVKRLEHDTDKYQNNKYVCTLHFKERIVRLSPTRQGYLTYRPSEGNKKLGWIRVHQMVARYFVPNPHNHDVVNHKDENKGFNHYSNLEFCTDKYNSNYGTCQQRRAVSIRAMRRRRGISIDQYTKDGIFIKHYSNKGEMDDAGFNLKTVLRVCNHTMESSQGYVWRFDGDPFTAPIYVDSKGGTIRKKVICYDLNGMFVAKYDNLLEASIAIGGRHRRNGICGCAYGKRKQAYGYIWKYANE